MKKLILFFLLSVLTARAQNESLKILYTENTNFEGRKDNTSSVLITGCDGIYKFYIVRTKDFKTWLPQFIVQFDCTGDLVINVSQRRDNWQKYDKTFEPCFWKFKLERVGDSKQIIYNQ